MELFLLVGSFDVSLSELFQISPWCAMHHTLGLAAVLGTRCLLYLLKGEHNNSIENQH